MLAGIARSLATLIATAYAIGPQIEPPEGERETRPPRLTLVVAGPVLSTLIEVPGGFVEL